MSDTANKIETPKPKKKNVRSTPFGPFLWLAIVSIVLVSGVALWVASEVNGPNVEVVLQGLPGLPVMSGKPEVFTRNMTRVDQEVRKAIETGPDPELLGNQIGRLGEVYQANDYYKRALQCYTIASELDPKNAKWPHHSAFLYQLRGDNESAIRYLERTVELSPDYLPAVLKLADIYYKSGQAKKAHKGYQACLQLSAHDRYALLGLARIAVDQSNWKDAQEILEKALKQHPDFGAINQLLATVYGHFGRMADKQRLISRSYIRFEEAPDPWTTELQLLCFDVDKLIAMGSKAKQLGHYERAEEIYKHAIKLAPDHVNGYVEIANLYLDSKRFSDANVYLQKAIKLDPNNPQPYFKSALLLLREKKRPKEAEELFLKALSLNEESNTYYYLAQCKYQQKQYADAIEYCKKSLELNLARRSAHYLWANCSRRLGDTDKAIEHYLEELKNNPDLLDARVAVAKLLLEKKNFKEAVYHFRRIAEVKPDDISVLNTLGWILAATPDTELRDPEAAVSFSKRACELTQRKVPVLLDTLAVAYASSGDFSRAIAVSTEAARLARLSGEEALANSISSRLKLYQSNKAYVEPIAN
ncbi:MAG: tetratricopeptide repeat protein [Planctomycetota bacterium]|jgi:tetratricopeptide (TPR) repeat protein